MKIKKKIAFIRKMADEKVSPGKNTIHLEKNKYEQIKLLSNFFKDVDKKAKKFIRKINNIDKINKMVFNNFMLRYKTKNKETIKQNHIKIINKKDKDSDLSYSIALDEEEETYMEKGIKETKIINSKLYKRKNA